VEPLTEIGHRGGWKHPSGGYQDAHPGEIRVSAPIVPRRVTWIRSC
jgi:hypothetical protein